MVAPKNDQHVVGHRAVVECVEQFAHHVVGERERGEVALHRFFPLAIFSDPLVPMPLGHFLTGSGNVAEIALQVFRLLDFIELESVKIFLRRVPRHMRPVNPDRQKQRLLVSLGQALGRPRDNLRISHFGVSDLQRRPIEMAPIKLSTAVDRPVFRHGLLRHLLSLGRKIIVPRPGIGVAAEVFLIEKSVCVKQLAGTQCEVAGIPEMPRQRDRPLQPRRLAPVVGIGINTGGRRPQSAEQTRA